MADLLQMKLGGLVTPSCGAAATGPPATGLWARYRADTSVTGTTNVSAWGDMSGNARDLAQGTGANQPGLTASAINGQPAITFVRANADRLVNTTAGTLAQPYTIVCVMRGNDATGNNYIAAVASGATNFAQLVYRGDTQHTYSIWAGSGDVVANSGAGNVTNNTWHWVQGDFNGASSAIWVDGTNIVTGNQNAGTTSLIGVSVGAYFNGTDPYNGDIAEVLIWDHILTSGERTTLDGYMASQFGI